MKNIPIFRTALVSALVLSGTTAGATILKGRVQDKKTGEPLMGATVAIQGTSIGAISDIDGGYQIKLKRGTYHIVSRYMGYKDYTLKEVKIAGDTLSLLIELEPEELTLSELTVTAKARRDSEAAQVQEQKNSAVVQNGVSAQEITKTQDKDASEVVKRIPGISIIDEKFVMVRGLSQRYNNVWLNGSAVPSSEADSRAFSFDVIPSSQLDNMVIVKSPAPEYPADFTGGFVLINTKRQPSSKAIEVALGLGANDETHFRPFTFSLGRRSTALGLGGSMGHIPGGIHSPLMAYPTPSGGYPKLDPIGSGLNNDWRVGTMRPLADLKLNLSYTNLWTWRGGAKFGVLAAVNYSNSFRSILKAENSLYGPYDPEAGRSVAMRKAVDDQYSREVRLGSMFNLSYRPRDQRHYFEWKNVFNQTSKNRYSERWGFNAQPDSIHDMEYYYSSRPTLSSQLTGVHTLDRDEVDWSAGYAFAQRDLPDRRLIQRTDRDEETMGIYRISREFTLLNEHTASLGLNYKKALKLMGLSATIKAGVYGEYRSRSYDAREFQYGWQPQNNLPYRFQFAPDPRESILVDANYGTDKLYLYEEVNFLNNYRASQALSAGYVGLNLPWHKFNLYTGLRYEWVDQTLWMNTIRAKESLQSTHYKYNDLFPSVNLVYYLSASNQLRLSYGRSTNRPEFRELSSSVFYDFELGSNVNGNPDLKPAYVDNLDLRWELYPSGSEQISVALFYKRFVNPIEWTYTVTGGTDLTYSFINAQGANNYGVEVDIRKSLDFLGLKGFSLSFNGALIKSKVLFDKSTNNIDRPMQGQSPYLINTGLFYQNSRHGWNVALLYNRIGKRIVGVGSRYGTASDGSSRNIPNSYEMPRNSLDLSIGKKLGKWHIKLSGRDLLSQSYEFKQIEEVTLPEGKRTTIEETTRSYKPGRAFSLSIAYKF